MSQDISLNSASPRLPNFDLKEFVPFLQNSDFSGLEMRVREFLAQGHKSPRLYHFLGLALMQQGRNDEACASFEMISGAIASEINVINQYGLALNGAKRHDAAVRVFSAGIKTFPDSSILKINLGKSLNDSGRYQEAEHWLEQAFLAFPHLESVRVNLAISKVKLRKDAEAKHLLATLVKDGYRGEEALQMYARLLIQDGEIQQAIEFIEDNFGISTDNREALITLADAALQQGAFSEAETLLLKLLASEPDNRIALATLPRIRKMTDQDRWILDRAQKLLVSEVSPHDAALCFALGKFCDDLGEYGNAFGFYDKANDIKQKGVRSYDPNRMSCFVDSIISNHDSAYISSDFSGALKSELPVLIVGMPRSGTSLTEQILSSVSGVFGAGELLFWRQAILSKPDLFFDKTLRSEGFQVLANDYVELLRSKNDKALRVVDKMPANFFYLGLVVKIFPNVKILHTMRNPIDTCLSIYFQDFNEEHTYATSLKNIAHFYKQYHRLMAHWREILPKKNFLEIPYELMVEDQESWSKKIVEFIGLPWSEKCLEFYKTKRRVGTASNWQARQPIYKTSKERWRNYEQHLGPLLPLLELYDPERGQI